MKKALFGIFLISSLITAHANSGEFELSTAVSGVVKEVKTKKGQKVKKGQVLLVLDQRVFIAELEAAKKSVNSASLDLEENKKELERTEELYDRTVISDHELELAKVNYAAAEKNYANAQKQLAHAQYQLDYSKIIAPVSGKIKSVGAWEGMVVNNQIKNTILITLEN